MNAEAPPESLETDRLLLRRPETDDAAAMFRRWAQDPAVTRYLLWRPHETVQESLDHVARCQQAWADGTAYAWFLEDRCTGELAGSIAARLDRRGVNLGYVLAQDCWGRGLMREALQPIVEWWLRQPDVFRVWATCDVDNAQSARVLEKLEFVREGTLRRWDHHPNLEDNPRDAVCYSKVR